MLIKTPEFVRKFVNDLQDITVFSKLYRDELYHFNRLSDREIEFIGFRNQKFSKLKFVGSFPDKKYGSIISDIDVVQPVYFNEGLINRFSQILSRLEGSNFIFVRLYCGLRKDLDVPWYITGSGSCNFSLEKIKPWLNYIKNHIDNNVYLKIKEILDDEYLSLKDLIDVEELIKPYTSISWSREDIVKGYKIVNDKRVNLFDSILSYTFKKVFKFIYKYGDEYCLVDCAFRQQGEKLEEEENRIEIMSYYAGNAFKRLKNVKRFLSEDLRNKDYKEDVSKNIGKYTSLASRIELIDKLKKYRVVDQKVVDKLTIGAKEYANMHNINTIDYDSLQKIISDNSESLLKKYSKLITNDRLRKFKLIEARRKEASLKISKKILKKREDKGLECSFFMIDVEDITYLIDACIRAKISPEKFLGCFYKSCREHKTDPYKEIKNFLVKNNYVLRKVNEEYEVLSNEKVIKKSKNKKKLQKLILFGEINGNTDK